MLLGQRIAVLRQTMGFVLAAVIAAICSAPANAAETAMDKQFYEVRTYQLGASGDEAALDQYLSEALLPALKKLGIGPVGAFHDPEAKEGERQLILVIPYKTPNQLVEIEQQLASDETYQAAAKEYLERPADQAAFERINSELLIAFDCMPELKVPEEASEGKDRIYELRTYESATEQRGDVKVEMFNSGEVPIFLDSGIRPVFFGQALIGPKRPNLTYLTVYSDDAARQDAWKAFVAHPDWKELSSQPKYKNTVSHIDKAVLAAKPYSQF